MLKHRILFGTLMSIFFAGLMLLDGWLDGSVSGAIADKPVQATLFVLLAAGLMGPAHLELGNLVKQTGVRVIYVATIPISILLATMPYWTQWVFKMYSSQIFILAIPFSLLTLFLIQAIQYGTVDTVRTVSASFFSIIYLGVFCMFLVWIRVYWGVWTLLFFVFTIKSSDIGAYTFGRWLGTHPLCPAISPGKTWEGLVGAAAVAAAVSFGFSSFCDIMTGLQAVIFGAVFGVLGQLGDLIESMIKRDAEAKDSSSCIPGFGGLLDVMDSPLATAPLAFAVFMWVL
ncbi:MAG: phosphatidate cytidylyltransferase [Planctomycetes bacterium]|nr:phosphatidate cytidylyltransferase [Planctomycetota bacterium]